MAARSSVFGIQGECYGARIGQRNCHIRAKLPCSQVGYLALPIGNNVVVKGFRLCRGGGHFEAGASALAAIGEQGELGHDEQFSRNVDDRSIEAALLVGEYS